MLYYSPATIPFNFSLKYLIQLEESDTALKTHCAVILGSLAKGIETDVANLLGNELLDVMLIGLRQSDLRYVVLNRCSFYYHVVNIYLHILVQ